MSHCRSSTVVSISDTLVSELVTLSTNSLYCNRCKDMTVVVLSASRIHANNGYTHTDSFSIIHFNDTLSLLPHMGTNPPHARQRPATLPRTSYLHGHLVVSALQESGQVSESNVVLQQSMVQADDVRLTIILTCYQQRLGHAKLKWTT